MYSHLPPAKRSHKTTQRSQTGPTIRAVILSLSTRQKDSTNTIRTGWRRHNSHDKAANISGTHVPGPLQSSKPGRRRRCNQRHHQNALRVDRTVDDQDCPTSRERGMRCTTAPGSSLTALVVSVSLSTYSSA
eukprot:GEMP01061059.1.p1 GENE.GEMP01061059.1~~GEMP01061059.1.p1  ORF type:complete len:132 (-),score=23.44 GEMP01061059.1:291-686(-)